MNAEPLDPKWCPRCRSTGLVVKTLRVHWDKGLEVSRDLVHVRCPECHGAGVSKKWAAAHPRRKE